MTLVLPTDRVYVAFNAGVNTPAASRTWTEVTSYVELSDEIGITYGANGWRSVPDANTLTLTLNNKDGRFTAGLSSSPYYPNVKLGRPIKVESTLDGITYPRFLGFIDEWPVEWPGGSDAYAAARVTASSRTAWLGTKVELRSIVEETILEDGPTYYATLGEPEGSTSANDSSGNNQPALTMAGSGTAVTFGTATGPGTDGLTAATFASGKYLRGVPVGTIDTVECFFVRSGIPGTDQGILGVDNGGGEGLCGLAVSSIDGELRLLKTTGGGVNSDLVTDCPNVTDNAVHHVAWQPSTGRVHLDGVLLQTTTPISTLTGATIVTVGGTRASSFGVTAGDPLTGTIAHVAVFASLPSDAAIADHAAAGRTGFAGETPAARITRYASFAGIAAAELDLDPGMVADLAHIDTTGKPALEVMRLVEQTEEGWLFDAQDGNLTFHARNHRYTATADAFILAADLEHVEEGITPRLDRSVLRNDVSAQTSDQRVTARVKDDDSIEAIGHARESLDLHTTDPDEPLLHASWLVNQFGEPRSRIPQLGLKLQSTLVVPFGEGPFGSGAFGSAVADILSATIGTRFTVEGMPAQNATQTQDYFIEGYTETIGVGYHNFVLNVTPADPYDVWTVGDPDLGDMEQTPLAF